MLERNLSSPAGFHTVFHGPESLKDKSSASAERSAEYKQQLQEKSESVLMQELADKPFNLIQAVGDKLKQLDFQGLPDLIKECPRISELRQEVLNLFQQAGYIEKRTEGYVVDLDKLKQLKYNSEIRNKLSVKYTTTNKKKASLYRRAGYFDHGNKSTILFYAFKGLPLISKEDYQRGNLQAKELFYIPATPEAALDIKQIKSHPDFHLGLWEIGRSRQAEIYAANGKKINAFEAQLACVIYHPHFADGERDNQGKLLVKYKSGQDKRPISHNFFRQYGFGSAEEYVSGIRLADNPYKYLKSKYGQELVKHNILKPEDFKLDKHASEFSYQPKKIPANGYVTFHNQFGESVRYYLGRRFGQENYWAVKIDESLGGILYEDEHGSRHLTHIFNLVDPQNENLNKTRTNKGSIIKTADQKLVQIRPYKAKGINPPADMQALILSDYNSFIEKANQIKQISGVDLLVQVDTPELANSLRQALLRTDKSPQEVGDFIKRYGLDNLSYFLSGDMAPADFDKYLSLGDELYQTAAKNIFDKFSEVVKLSRQSRQELVRDFFKGKSKYEFDPTSAILMRGRKILMSYADKLASAMVKDKQALYISLLKELDELKQEVIFMAAMFKEYYQQADQVDFQELKGVDYARLRADQLNPDDIQQMKKIYAANYQAYPAEFRQKLLESFDSSLADSHAYYDILRYQGKIVAFLRFDYLGEEAGSLKKHFAAFNVDKNFTQAKLGEAMLKQALQREKSGSVITAECDPQAPITKKYLELGFKKVKEFDLAGVPSWQIELRD